MDALYQVDIAGEQVKKIVEHPDNYPDEMLAVAIDVVNNMARQIREAKLILEAHLVKRMKDENATKMPIIGLQGKEQVATRKKGSFKCDSKDADVIFQNYGFDPTSIGDYVFKPSWTKAKEARKLGGDMQLLIDEFFKEGKESITISDK